MEPTHDLIHPSEEELAAFGDPALGAETLERLALHLDSCPTCRVRLEWMEPVLSQYTRCFDAVHLRVPRPQPWSVAVKNMHVAVKNMHTAVRNTSGKPRRRFTSWQLAWAGGLAASVAGFFLFFSVGGNTSELRAETLLTKAATSARGTARHRLRVRTQNALFIRPSAMQTAIPEEGSSAAVRAHFAAANYDWQDPLSAQSYSAWRHTLKHKTSKVSNSVETPDATQKIETTTEDGTLRTASLTFDAKLAPVSGLFQFADREWVEITTVPDTDPNRVAGVVPAEVTAPPAAGTNESVPRQPLAERELNVRLAIDALHASASEPIEVSTGSGDILVTTYHLTPEQEKKLTASLHGMSGVTLRTLHETGQTPRVSDATDVLLRTSQDLSFEAHLLAELSDHFQPAAEATLSESSRSKLWNLRASHVREMNRHLARLQQELQKASPDFHVSADAALEPSAHGVQALANRTSAVDRLIIVLSASEDNNGGREALWRQISTEFTQLRSIAKDYSRSIEEDRKKRE